MDMNGLLDASVRDTVATVADSVTPLLHDPVSWEQGRDALARVFALSPYVANTCRRYPDELARLLNEGSLDRANPSDSARVLSLWANELRDDFERHQTLLSTPLPSLRAREPVEQSTLRRFRHRHMVRILWRVLTDKSSLVETLADLSSLADVAIRQAAFWAHEHQTGRYGEPRDASGRQQQLIVLGMGKLGGGELNVSSDIDLIYVWPAPGQTDGRKTIDNAEFFQRVARRLSQLLGAVTEDGFVYRVDTRLRPFGESGPLVMNFDGLENYWLTQARDWERYAMVKARAVTGDPEDIAELQSLYRPFVFRRYLDYSAIESLRDLKRKIALSVKRQSMQDNIKLGSGGIREIEFIGQAFQLVRGGREPRLQIRPIRQVLALLVELQLLQEDEHQQLIGAYDYLRLVENAVQMMRDEQVHSIPTDSTDQLRLLEMMGEADWDQFRARLDTHQSAVRSIFDALFEVSEETDGAVQAWAIASAMDSTAEDVQSALIELGIEAEMPLVESLDAVARGAFYQRLTAVSKQRMDRMLPLLLHCVLEQDSPAEALARGLHFVRSVAGRSGYLQVLADHPDALKRLVHLFSESSWLTEFVSRHPIVVDELLDTRNDPNALDCAVLRQAGIAEGQRLLESDLEQQMDTLRQFRHTRELAIATAELEGNLTLMQVSDALSGLAEGLIEAVLTLVSAALARIHGWPSCQQDGQTVLPDVGVVAYGKLGGLELGYGSDLDLVFLHDSSGQAQHSNGDKPIENALWYAKLAQKFVHFMSASMPAGELYEIDFRLRPNGASGVLVTSVGAFEQYQLNEAWTWEHQALMRSRIVYGSPALQQHFDDIRRTVLSSLRVADQVRIEVAKMREKMRQALGSKSADRMDLKQDSGGVADIEFVVQYFVLAYAARHPELVCHTDNVRVLEAIGAVGLLDPQDAAFLSRSFVELRSRLHRLALQQSSGVVPIDAELAQLRQSVIEIRDRVLGEAEIQARSTLD